MYMGGAGEDTGEEGLEEVRQKDKRANKMGILYSSLYVTGQNWEAFTKSA